MVCEYTYRKGTQGMKTITERTHIAKGGAKALKMGTRRIIRTRLMIGFPFGL